MVSYSPHFQPISSHAHTAEQRLSSGQRCLEDGGHIQVQEEGARRDERQLWTELVSRDVSHGDRIQAIRRHKTYYTGLGSKTNSCFWQDKQGEMFQKCSVGTRGETQNQRLETWNFRRKTKLGLFCGQWELKSKTKPGPFSPLKD